MLFETYGTGGKNYPPDKPDNPSGPASGNVRTEYTYTAVTTDPEGEQIWYLFDWDASWHHDYSGWLGPFASGATGSAKHKWTSQGDYQIRVKAKDVYGFESDWSDPFSVSMPKNKPYINRPILQFLQNLIQRFPLLARLLQLPVFDKSLNQ